MPIVNAPMGGVAGGRLAAAVTAAGGLGMARHGQRRVHVVAARRLPEAPGRFGIGWWMGDSRKKPALFDSHWPLSRADFAISSGMTCRGPVASMTVAIAAATQVYNSVEAQAAQDAGIDLVVAAVAKAVAMAM